CNMHWRSLELCGCWPPCRRWGYWRSWPVAGAGGCYCNSLVPKLEFGNEGGGKLELENVRDGVAPCDVIVPAWAWLASSWELPDPNGDESGINPLPLVAIWSSSSI